MSLTGADFEAVFLAALQDNDDLKALVGDRVFALIIPDGTYLPCVTFQRISGTPANTLGGRSGLEEIEMQVDVWARTYAEAKAVAKAVRDAVPARGAVFGAHLIQDSDTYESETNYYRITMEYTCWMLED